MFSVIPDICTTLVSAAEGRFLSIPDSLHSVMVAVFVLVDDFIGMLERPVTLVVLVSVSELFVLSASFRGEARVVFVEWSSVPLVATGWWHISVIPSRLGPTRSCLWTTGCTDIDDLAIWQTGLTTVTDFTSDNATDLTIFSVSLGLTTLMCCGAFL